MTHSDVDVLVIGGGVAAGSVAVTLRREGFVGSVTVVSREFEAPYHRPPITKELLRSGMVATRFLPANWWSDESVDLRLRSAVTALDPGARLATLADRSTIGYQDAVFATGGMVRRLAVDGASMTGVHYLRTPANAEALREDCAHAATAVLVGGSFLAVEVAASLVCRGLKCTLVMTESHPLERSVGRAVAVHLRQLLGARGIEFQCDADVTAFLGEERVTGVRTSDGRQVDGDLVVVGVGAVPDVRLARRAGLAIGPTGGIQCDRRLAASIGRHYAAGDVCEYDSVVHGRSLRVEHEEHALAQGRTVAANLLGGTAPHLEVPYFWTDLGEGLVLESVGPAACWDEEVLWGSLEDSEFTVWYLESGRLVAALTAGRPADLDRARELIGSPGGNVDWIRGAGVALDLAG